MNDRDTPSGPTALVTGASRGIGRACAIALAEAGFDVAITARTVHDGDPTAFEPDTGAPLPGSLASTASAIESSGSRAVPIRLDLLDLDALAPAVDAAIVSLGHLDVLVNNAIYVGPGANRRFLETEPDDLARRVSCNVTAQLLITQRAVAHMVGRGDGLVLDITSAAGQRVPRRPVGEGGWPLTYAVTKAGFHRIADMLALEYGDAGIRAFNLNPGFVVTERVRAVEDLSFVADRGITPEVVGRVVAWFVTTGQHRLQNGSYHQVTELARELGYLP
ncbi:MAG: SDR family oxidoreductase [Acidimicrobiales bacterium]|jgi:NAD(P)-dependent dehydrogenase (short-subunit alcohol dehydrogenase family)